MSWTQTSAITSDWTSVASDSTGQYLVASSKIAGVYTNNNYGNGTWTFSVNKNNEKQVASSSSGQYLVLCDSIGIYTNNNYGSGSWTSSGTYPNIASIASNSSGQFLVMSILGTGIYTNNNYGNVFSWQLVVNGTLTYIASNSTGQYLVTCNTNGIFINSNYGSGSWTQTTAISAIWTCLASSSTGQYLVACAGGGSGTRGIYINNNYGNGVWTQTSAISANWTSVASNSTGQYLVACVGGSSGTRGIYINNNYGNGVWTQTDAISADWTSVASNSDGSKLFAVVNNGGIYTYTSSNPDVTTQMVCFLEDTKILTKQGYRPIQDLRNGDLIKTIKHGYVPIDMIGYRHINNPICEERIKDKLYVCSNKEYSEIFEDLVITGCHSILVDDFISEEEKTNVIRVNGDTFVTDNKYRLPACVDVRAKPYEKEGIHTIYHLALEHDDYLMNYGIYANGLIVETCSKRNLNEFSNMIFLE